VRARNGPDHPERVIEGLMRMHLHCERVSFEIPSVLMGRDMLLNTEFAGLSAGSDYVAPGMVADSRVCAGSIAALACISKR